MRVGLLGGSFDPVHFGHLRAAQWALETLALDQVRLVPARQSPFKGPCSATPTDRLDMLSVATADNPFLTIDDCELRRDAPSYTVDTLRTLTGQLPGATITLILGSDAARDIEKWREIDKIRSLAEICILQRPGVGLAMYSQDAAPFEGLAISSSQIRDAVRHGRSIRYLTPESVRFFIEEKGLYK